MRTFAEVVLIGRLYWSCVQSSRLIRPHVTAGPDQPVCAPSRSMLLAVRNTSAAISRAPTRCTTSNASPHRGHKSALISRRWWTAILRAKATSGARRSRRAAPLLVSESAETLQRSAGLVNRKPPSSVTAQLRQEQGLVCAGAWLRRPLTWTTRPSSIRRGTSGSIMIPPDDDRFMW